jgi:hypothetical protein
LTIKTLGQAQRGCIFRLGRFYRVAGPGSVFLIPLVDQIAVVDLDRTIPEWREVPPPELEAMVEFLVTHYPEVPSHLSLAEIREAMVRGEKSA